MYPPATAFEQPLARAEVLSVEHFSLAELRDMPEAWGIVVKHVPSLKMMVTSSLIQPHLGNFTLHSVQTFVKTVTPQTIAAINDELRQLPPVEPKR